MLYMASHWSVVAVWDMLYVSSRWLVWIVELIGVLMSNLMAVESDNEALPI